MPEFTAPSGAVVVMSMASFQDAMSLKDCVSEILSESGIDIKSIVEKYSKQTTGKKGKDNFLQSEISDVISEFADPLFKSVLKLDSSKELRANIFKCLERCKYGSEKITMDTFESPKARGDYYSILFQCLKENLLPFFQSLSSKLPTFQKIVSKSQKSS